MPQLWQGRSSKAVDSRVNDFNSSIRFDARMIEQDIHGSMVHSAMLGKQGIISQQDVDDIHKGLQSILNDLHSGALEIDPNAEDVHTFVERIPGFWAVFGFVACVVIIIVSKWFGHLGIMTREDYYDD